MNSRIRVIDSIRGLALLGLPTMNIVAFSMPFAAYFNPYAYGTASYVDHALFVFFSLFADQKFMGLFSTLFGASMLLLLDGLEQKKFLDAGTWVAKRHYLRNFWLLVFGVLHAMFLWEGDVLSLYAILAMLLYVFRHLSPAILFGLSLALIVLSASFPLMVDVTTMDSLNTRELNYFFAPDSQQIAQQVSIYSGDYQTLLKHMSGMDSSASESNDEELISSWIALFAVGASVWLRAFSMMLLGMALYRWAVFQGTKSQTWCRNTALFCLLIGIPTTAVGVFWNYSHDFSLQSQFSVSLTTQVLGGYITVLGYIYGLLWLYSSARLQALLRGFANVGRMSLTNYLMQSFICAWIFYGYGAGWYGQLNRFELLLVVVSIWLLQYHFSKWWLNHMQQGL